MSNHVSLDNEKLLLIKASAGSGKTHRLTGEYLRLLFLNESHYKHILAVTFTNKATDEMKMRIVQELYMLADGQNSGYLPGLMNTYQLSESAVREKAAQVLENILHDYSSFSVSTIDKFFQQTMRSFAREMGLAGGYKLELDQTTALMQIVDLMIFELDDPKNKELAGWILQFMKSQIEEGKSWNIKERIGDLASQIFNEKYKLLSADQKEKIEDKDNLKAYREKLFQIIKSWEREVKDTASHALTIMRRYDLDVTDFKYGKTSGFLSLGKLVNGDFTNPSDRFFTRCDNLNDWFTAKSPKKDDIEAAFHNGLNDCIKQLCGMFENNIDYLTAKCILQNYYTLGILNDVRLRLRQYQKENNTLFISDTTELLNKIIAESDSPFVYEKTGSRIANYMIDEFQDTSSMQWQNFKPLVTESLANGHFNLIVGDVKQSIYRWRNSDWGLLESHIAQEYGSEVIKEEVLDKNWRSDNNVIMFNNTIFKISSDALQDLYSTECELLEDDNKHIQHAYRHTYQHIPPHKMVDEGHVKITFLNDKDNEQNWKGQALQKLPATLEALQDQGFCLKDIAILVRTNNEAVEVADTLLKYQEANPDSRYRYDVISNEALLIGKAQSVKAVIALLRHFQTRNDETKHMMAVYEFHRFHSKLSPEVAINSFFESGERDFPDDVKKKLEKISSLPFYEMIEAFFALNPDAMDEKENAYVQAFLDIVLKYSIDNTSNTSDFLEWWDEKGHKKALFSPDEQDAVRLLTIHKSKGLGFDAVIMPLLNWDIDHKPLRGPILWCRPNTAPFNQLGILPVKYSKSLIDTHFKADYREEKLYAYIDNLNLLYVAFTRAKHCIVAFSPLPQKDAISNVAGLLWKGLQNETSMDNGKCLNNYMQITEDEACFELGSPINKEKKSNFSDSFNIPVGKWRSVHFDGRLKLRLQSEGFFDDEGERTYDKLMHEVMITLETKDDLENIMDQKYMTGEIDNENRSIILDMMRNAMNNPVVENWYSGKYHIINEAEIVHPHYIFNRPDRVMLYDNQAIIVDYEFTNSDKVVHKKKMKQHMRLIKSMGYEQTKGYIFYVKEGLVFEV